MENFEIQNHLGEVITASVTREELDVLIIEAETGVTDNTYFQHDSNPEYDMVTRIAQAKSEDDTLNIETFRIYKRIGE